MGSGRNAGSFLALSLDRRETGNDGPMPEWIRTGKLTEDPDPTEKRDRKKNRIISALLMDLYCQPSRGLRIKRCSEQILYIIKKQKRRKIE